VVISKKNRKARKIDKSQIAELGPLSDAIKKFSEEKRSKMHKAGKVAPWHSSVFIVYDYGQNGHFFYHIPKDALTEKEFRQVVETHGKLINVHDDDNLMWLHDQLMQKEWIHNDKGKNPKKDGKWFKYRIPSDDPFHMRGDFYTIQTGFAD
jgi:hypothetical protein